jgi:hypothetical protein
MIPTFSNSKRGETVTTLVVAIHVVKDIGLKSPEFVVLPAGFLFLIEPAVDR